jgi:hypothetical protein
MRRVALHGHRYGQARVAAPIPGGSTAICLPVNAQQPRTETREGAFMLDIVMLALGLGFFMAAVGYTYACERL